MLFEPAVMFHMYIILIINASQENQNISSNVAHKAQTFLLSSICVCKVPPGYTAVALLPTLLSTLSDFYSLLLFKVAA